MSDHRPERRRRTARLGLSLCMVVATLASVASASGVQRPTSFRDSFDELGPLKGHMPSDPYEIKRGDWEVVDLPDVLTLGNPRRVLRQNSTDTTPDEPVVFVRASSFRQLSVQVTAALIDSGAASSLGIVFRAPVLEDQTVDPDNLYLFSAINMGGISRDFPTGRIFALFKRVGQGHYMLTNRVVHTWADLTRPHKYKVQMFDGHIRAFVDGRLIIEHTDIPSPDVPTKADPFPGLPFHAGSVGLRTSKARAWFDDLVIVADDAYEARSAAIEGFQSYPIRTEPQSGIELTLSNQLDNADLNVADTGFVYSDTDFERAIVRPFELGDTELGASLGVRSDEGTTVATARAMRVRAEIKDPTELVTVAIDAAKIESTATASCTASTSAVDLSSTTVSVTLASSGGAPDTVIGPFPIESSYTPNTILYEVPGVVQIVAHRRIRSAKPHWVQASALSVVFPVGELELSETNVGGTRVLSRTSLGQSPGLTVDLGLAVAGRICTKKVETDT